MSTGRAVRLAQMLGLYRLDATGSEVKQILPPPRDWIELEERRRTFWAAFYGDRWASCGTGWPMLINENEVCDLDLGTWKMPEDAYTILDPDKPSCIRRGF